MHDQAAWWLVTGGYAQVVVSDGELTFLGAGNGAVWGTGWLSRTPQPAHPTHIPITTD